MVIDVGAMSPADSVLPITPQEQHKRRWAVIDINLGVAFFFMQDMAIKAVSHDYALSQLLLLRAAVAIPFVLWLVSRWPIDGKVAGIGALLSPRWRYNLLRGMLGLVCYVFYFLSLPALPLGIAVSIFMTAPLFLVLFGKIFIGEPITRPRLFALLIGFIGSLIIFRPWEVFIKQGAVFDYALLLPIISAIGYGLMQTMTRKFLQNESPFVMVFYQSSVYFVAAAVAAVVFSFWQLTPDHISLFFLVRQWVDFTPQDFIFLVGASLIGSIGIIFLTKAYRNAAATLVAPFEYMALPMGFVFGYLLWNEVPNIGGVLGAVMIMVAGLIVIADIKPNRRFKIRWLRG
ncbi:MAG: DMT family transporter [Alphaproteobacteria bacterium]